jgi:hypothetical protein
VTIVRVGTWETVSPKTNYFEERVKGEEVEKSLKVSLTDVETDEGEVSELGELRSYREAEQL